MNTKKKKKKTRRETFCCQAKYQECQMCVLEIKSKIKNKKKKKVKQIEALKGRAYKHYVFGVKNSK